MSTSSGASFGDILVPRCLTPKLAPLLALTKDDDNNYDDDGEEVDHSQLETLLQQWQREDDQTKENENDEETFNETTDDIQDGYKLQEVEVIKEDNNEDVKLSDPDIALQQLDNLVSQCHHVEDEDVSEDGFELQDKVSKDVNEKDVKPELEEQKLQELDAIKVDE